MEILSKLRTLVSSIPFKTLFADFFLDKPLIGIDLGNYAIKILQLKDKKGNLNSVGIYNLPEEALTAKDKREYLVSGISILIEQLKLKQKEVAICLSSKDVVTKKIEIVPVEHIDEVWNLEKKKIIRSIRWKKVLHEYWF